MSGENALSNNAFYAMQAQERVKRPIIGFMNANFPLISWGCMVDLDSGMACLIPTDLTLKHGYYFRMADTVLGMERQMMNIGGQILERFGINSHQDLIDMPRRMDGEALNAAKGER